MIPAMSNHKVKTLDGERTRVEELNLGPADADPADKSLAGRIKSVFKNLSLVMAGMYTGLNCYGTPHAEREVDRKEGGETPDRRLI